jgi:hypothetical protein
MNNETRETADLPPAETATAPVPKRETKREKRARLQREMADLAKATDDDEPEEIHPTKRPDWVPRAIRMQRHALRVNPKAAQVRVLRSWQGVRNGQIVVLHPAELKRRLASRMVEVVNAK